MSDIGSIPATKIVQGSAPASQALGGATSGVTANFAGGGNFWDMIFTSVLSGDLTAKKSDAANITGLTNSLVATDAKPEAANQNPMALLQIALSNQTIDENGNIVLPDAAGEDAKALQSNLDLTNTIINHLKNVLPEGAQQEGIFSKLLGRLQTHSENLRADITALSNVTLDKAMPVEDIPMPLMIAFGLTPAEIAQVSDNIKALEGKLGREITIEDLIAGIGNAIPQQQTQQSIAAATIPNIQDNTEPTDDMAAQLNALDIGGEEDPLQTTFKPLPKTASDLRADVSVEGTQDIDGHITHADAKKAAMNFKDNLTAQAQPAKEQAIVGTSGEILIPVSLFSSESETTLWQQAGMAPSASTSLNLSPAAQAASMTSGNTHAGQTHPASQLVAATLTRAGKEGVSDTMTLQLDPPELGSVNVRIEFGKDKSVKAHLLVEKPETYMMLQRDGLALERALQSAGLEATSNSLSFELAQGGADQFRNDGQGGGEKNLGNKTAATTADDTSTITSTMTWHVDSATGHVRYDILA
jgi:hypothetical protein